MPRQSVVLAEDETELMMFPPFRSGWSPQGEPVEVGLSGGNARRVIFGAMNLRTGTRLLMSRIMNRSGDYQAVLAEVRAHYRGRHVSLLLDEGPTHRARASLQTAEGMTLLWPPTRAPELNPMDTLWRQGKDVVSANKQYDTIEEHVERFLEFVEGLSGQEALHTSGVLSDDFWLKATLSKKCCLPA